MISEGFNITNLHLDPLDIDKEQLHHSIRFDPKMNGLFLKVLHITHFGVRFDYSIRMPFNGCLQGLL